MIRYILSFIFSFIVLLGFGQVDFEQPVKWEFSIQNNAERTTLIFEAKLNPGWRIYSQNSDPNGPEPTYIDFVDEVELIGEVIEKGKLTKKNRAPF